MREIVVEPPPPPIPLTALRNKRTLPKPATLTNAATATHKTVSPKKLLTSSGGALVAARQDHLACSINLRWPPIR